MVNSAIISKALMERPDWIVFTKNVRKFDMLAFKDVDCSNFVFTTATNLERIGTRCFKNAKNIHWSEVLEKASQEDNSFENAHIIGKENTKTI